MLNQIKDYSEILFYLKVVVMERDHSEFNIYSLCVFQYNINTLQLNTMQYTDISASLDKLPQSYINIILPVPPNIQPIM